MGSDLDDETKIIDMGMKGITSNASTSSYNDSYESLNDNKRNEIFHIRVIIYHNKVDDTLFDSGSEVNLISEPIVQKLKLETTPHVKPYPLVWL